MESVFQEENSGPATYPWVWIPRYTQGGAHINPFSFLPIFSLFKNILEWFLLILEEPNLEDLLFICNKNGKFLGFLTFKVLKNLGDFILQRMNGGD